MEILGEIDDKIGFITNLIFSKVEIYGKFDENNIEEFEQYLRDNCSLSNIIPDEVNKYLEYLERVGELDNIIERL
ncbi:MAG: hypothetical protein LBD88_02645 [Candidatus Peribacteria bacterium]|jgi:acylphosphatase|nr:hypothetical protein [Candidatus Peribacteria bacterium]